MVYREPSERRLPNILEEISMSAAAQAELGSVVSLWRYPVKSMVGEGLNATEITERGLVGDRGRFRPNIVVEAASGDNSFVENSWVGYMLAIRDEVRLSITGPCARCVMTTLA